jgi:phosphoglycerate dehydrogenase-like enzyme
MSAATICQFGHPAKIIEKSAPDKSALTFNSRNDQFAILVNTSRGPVVDQYALFESQKSRPIFAAGLDVTDPEPLPLDSPLLQLENLVICPHIASASWATRAKMALMAAENLIAGLKGERLPNCVNPEVHPKREIPWRVPTAGFERIG